MISKHLQNKIKDEIEDKEDFEAMKKNFEMSSAPLEERQEAIKYLEKQYPEFVTKKHTPKREVFEMIRAGESDISDMGGY